MHREETTKHDNQDEDSEGEESHFKESKQIIDVRLADRIEKSFDDATNKDYSWKILLAAKDFELQLAVDDTYKFSTGWYREVEATVKLVNRKTEEASITKKMSGKCTEEKPSLVFQNFADPSVLKDSDFVLDKCIRFEITIKVTKEKGCSLLHELSFGQKVVYNGLKNQGATCYMNSLLQALFHLAMFRKAVYNLPTENDKVEESIPLALQRLFYRLQFGDQPVGTKELTVSFGWTTTEVFVQHDVQELNRVLFEALEERMKTTPSEGILDEMFQGKILNYIECLNIPFKSERIENYCDLQLVVKGCKTIYESLDKYVEIELLNGNNQYNAEPHGLQDAKKGVILKTLPPVLFLHLRRFDFDMQTLRNYKVNDKFEFYDSIDLSKYVLKEGTDLYDKSTKYQLHGVLVHSGTIMGGHYYAFFRPTSAKKWFKFNDSVVTRATSEQAIKDTWGQDNLKDRSNANAYMLVYIRDTDVNEVLHEVPKNSIPAHINRRFEEEELERKRKQQEKEEALKYFTVHVVLEEDFKKHTSVDLINFVNSQQKDRFFKILKELTILDLKKMIMERFGFPLDKQRLWQFTTRKNNTVRTSKPKEDADSLRKLTGINDKDGTLRFFCELSMDIHPYKNTPIDPYQLLFSENSETSSDPLFPKVDGCANLFFKFYDPTQRTLEFVGRLYVPSQTLFSDVKKLLARWKQIPDENSILLYEEIKFNPPRLDVINDTSDIKKAALGNGDIVIFQVKTEVNNTDNTNMETAPKYFEWLANTIDIEFRLITNPTETVSIKLDKRLKWKEVATKLAEKIGLDNPGKLTFTKHSSITEKPTWSGPMIKSLNRTLDAMIFNYTSSAPILYYEILPITLKELQSKVPVNIIYQNSKTETIFDGTIYLDKSACLCTDLMDEVKKKFELANETKVRVMQLSNNQVWSLLKGDKNFSTSTSTKYLVEVCSQEELDMKEGDFLIAVQHIESDNYIFGNPFMFVAKKDEKLSEIKERIKKKLEIPDEEFKNWKVMSQYFRGKTEPLDDDYVIASDDKFKDPTITTYLALRHSDKNKKASKDTGIHIKHLKKNESPASTTNATPTDK